MSKPANAAMRVGLATCLLAALLQLSGRVATAARFDTLTVHVFRQTALHFNPDSAARYLAPGERAEDRGRAVSTTVTLPELRVPHRIQAQVTFNPVFKDDRSVFDRYDRAANLRLAFSGKPDVEIVRLMTSYGGRTEHRVDVTDLAPLLRGRQVLRAFVDTWVSPGWRVDFALRYVPDTTADAPAWAMPVYYTDSFNRQDMPRGAEAQVDIPAGLSRVVMKYTSTGHCTDGHDEDEFVSKANVISVDGVVVARLHPWRDDCRKFRDRNPYCTRWADGSWSSDYSRSGWCPGVEVAPTEIDLTDQLTPGRHAVRFVVEDMRPKDAQGNFGYWRISSYLAGWDHPPRLWRNP